VSGAWQTTSSKNYIESSAQSAASSKRRGTYGVNGGETKRKIKGERLRLVVPHHCQLLEASLAYALTFSSPLPSITQTGEERAENKKQRATRKIIDH